MTAIDLQLDLLRVFDKHDVDVGVGLTKDGVAIRSQDKRVDAANLGALEALRGRIEQDLENQQVRALRDRGFCPVCGAEDR